MKRFTSTKKWDDQWFRNLSPIAKLLWMWLCDHCDNAGVVEPDYELASFQITAKVEQKHIDELVTRIKPLNGGGKLWIEKFIEFQFGSLNPDSRVHSSVLTLLNKHGIPYSNPMDRVSIGEHATPKDKEKDKDKDLGGCGGIAYPPTIDTPEFREVFVRWMAARRGMGKKPKDWCGMFQEQLKWLAGFGAVVAAEMCMQSIRNGWQGLFELKGTQQTQLALKVAAVGPKLAELQAYAREHGHGDKSGKYAASFMGFWADPKRRWQRNGKQIDWKIEFSKQLNQWRAAEQA